MMLKEPPETKIPATKTNKKKLSEIQDGEKKPDTSLLKKNEFTMILIGALLLTLIVFFFFFRTPDPVHPPVSEEPSASSSPELVNRIEKMEQTLQTIEKSTSPEGMGTAKERAGVNPLEERVARLETAFSVKMESMIERMGKIEKHIAQLTAKQDALPDTSGSTPEPVAVPEKKTVKKEKKDPIFHTVQKGETLFSISRKYKTSVETLKKLNNMSSDTPIFPGNNILVR